MTYKVKCRVCGKIREFVFYSSTDPKDKLCYSEFIGWINGHLNVPIIDSCVCSENHRTIQDLISFSKEDTEHYGKFDYKQRKEETRRQKRRRRPSETKEVRKEGTDKGYAYTSFKS